jgi:4-diphosphocytidyl-2-C-methyl-D-erythritol kinase
VSVTTVTVRVPAKINLQLAVGPLRPDGYHGLVTVFHAVSLFDDVTVGPAAADTVTVTGEGASVVPANGDNLALRAVRALRETIAQTGGKATADGTDGVAVAIDKHIPVAGGMAGGSADAAAALVACNELWNAGLSQQDLCAVAARVGSDTAFAVIGGTAVGQGRGEQLTPILAAPATYHWVLALANGHLSTPAVYKELDRQRASAKVKDPALNPDLMTALKAADPAQLGAAIANDLEAPALALFPALNKTLKAGKESGALGALVSGSGPTCYFLASNQAHATELAQSLSSANICRATATATGPAAGASIVDRTP